MKKNEKPLLDALLQDLRDYCAERRGRVSELANHLEVAQQQASNWLAGKSEPGGEATLRMMRWLETSRAADAAARDQLAQAAPPRLAAAIKGVPVKVEISLSPAELARLERVAGFCKNKPVALWAKSALMDCAEIAEADMIYCPKGE
jgi:hypothetical protein